MDPITTHKLGIRVYAEDVDYMGIVYHPNYLCYLERARTEMLRVNNLCLSDLMAMNILFAINELTVKYLLPAKLDDLLTVHSDITDLKACSFIFKQIVSNQNGKVICEAKVQVVCVDSNLRPKRLPNLLKPQM